MTSTQNITVDPIAAKNLSRSRLHWRPPRPEMQRFFKLVHCQCLNAIHAAPLATKAGMQRTSLVSVPGVAVQNHRNDVLDALPRRASRESWHGRPCTISIHSLQSYCRYMHLWGVCKWARPHDTSNTNSPRFLARGSFSSARFESLPCSLARG